MVVVAHSWDLLCRMLALSFVGSILISAFSVHHGGRMKGSIVSIFPTVMCGNCWSMFSRFDRCLTFAVLVLRAFLNHSHRGCFPERDCIREMAWSTLV